MQMKRFLLLVVEKKLVGTVLLVVCWLGALLLLVASLLGLVSSDTSERAIYALLVVGVVFFAIGPLLAKDIDRRS